MELVGILVVVLAGFWIARAVRNHAPSKLRLHIESKRVRRIVDAEQAWLNERWEHAESGASNLLPGWYHDSVTEPQIDKLESLGIRLSGKPLNKGQASDLIGLFYGVDEDDRQLLRFHKVPLKGLNQSTGRDKATRLRVDAQSATKWDARPATPLQREYMKFFGLTRPKGMSFEQAEQLQREHQEADDEVDEAQWRRWEQFEELFEELSDRETRHDYGLKAVSMKAFKAALLAVLRDERKPLNDVDIVDVIDKLIKHNPSTERTLDA